MTSASVSSQQQTRAASFMGWLPRGGWMRDHIAIARPDHWFKNVFVLPGAGLALALSGAMPGASVWLNLAIAIVATCLVASANYTINEWLDAAFDRHHPVKCLRPSASGRLRAGPVYMQWFVLAASGLSLASLLGLQFLLLSLALLVMGVIYNVKPMRTKDRQYLDVLSEAVNNPLRFMLGWTAVLQDVLPPSSILIAYWMGGAFLMAVKRYAEYRYINDASLAGNYRRSFRFYTEPSLLLSAFFYALSASFFLSVFLVKYRIEFIVAIPFLAALFVWYFWIGMKPDSVTQRPEKLYKERGFVSYVGGLGLLSLLLLVVDLPWLRVLVEFHVLGH